MLIRWCSWHNTQIWVNVIKINSMISMLHSTDLYFRYSRHSSFSAVTIAKQPKMMKREISFK